MGQTIVEWPITRDHPPVTNIKEPVTSQSKVTGVPWVG